jgi:type III restriction enzyme
VKRGIVNNANGIKYERIGDEYWSQKLFEEDDENNIIAYLNKNAIEAKSGNCLHNYVKYDSGIESKFAERLMNDPDIKLFAKIPDWFKINTPVGTYNPDWLILLNYNDEEKLYFIVETKGKLDNLDLDLKGIERAKIACAKEHFKALNTGISFNTAADYDEWLRKCRP